MFGFEIVTSGAIEGHAEGGQRSALLFEERLRSDRTSHQRSPSTRRGSFGRPADIYDAAEVDGAGPHAVMPRLPIGRTLLTHPRLDCGQVRRLNTREDLDVACHVLGLADPDHPQAHCQGSRP